MPYAVVNKNELMHHGILGQKWGVRRYQNEDGSYTKAGKKRYNLDEAVDTITNKTVEVAAKASKGISHVTDKGEQKISKVAESVKAKTSNAGSQWSKKNSEYIQNLKDQKNSTEKVNLSDRVGALTDVITSSSAVAAMKVANIGSNVIEKGASKVNSIMHRISNKLIDSNKNNQKGG